MQLLTERLFLIPLQPDGMRALLARTTDPELVGPYTEMLTLSLRTRSSGSGTRPGAFTRTIPVTLSATSASRVCPKTASRRSATASHPNFRARAMPPRPSAPPAAGRWPSPAWPPWRLRPNPPMLPPRRFSARSASSPPGRWARRGRGSFCAPCPPERSFFGVPLYISLNLCHNLRY